MKVVCIHYFNLPPFPSMFVQRRSYISLQKQTKTEQFNFFKKNKIKKGEKEKGVTMHIPDFWEGRAGGLNDDNSFTTIQNSLYILWFFSSPQKLRGQLLLLRVPLHVFITFLCIWGMGLERYLKHLVSLPGYMLDIDEWNPADNQQIDEKSEEQNEK